MADLDLMAILARNPGVDKKILQRNLELAAGLTVGATIRPNPKVGHPYNARRLVVVDEGDLRRERAQTKISRR